MRGSRLFNGVWLDAQGHFDELYGVVNVAMHSGGRLSRNNVLFRRDPFIQKIKCGIRLGASAIKLGNDFVREIKHEACFPRNRYRHAGNSVEIRSI